MSQLFRVNRTCSHTAARAGTLSTPHGSVQTPVFMPVGSQGTVKTLTPDELRSIGVGLILANMYHLYLRPGIDVITSLGGLHGFMSWDGPILTDSGGFQIFSLGHLRSVSDEGALFHSHIDGSEYLLTPELAIAIQEQMGADIIMVLDECPPYGYDIKRMQRSMERSHLWARRSLDKHKRGDQALFGIVHGGTFGELRRQSADFLTSLDFAGYAIGGLSLGEPKELMHKMLDETVPFLPEAKPRYLMGVGSPEDLVECVARGVDMFDSVLPTRIARNGAVFTLNRRCNLGNARFKDEAGPVDPECDCYTCRTFSAGYLSHLFKCRELLAYRLATIHNVTFITRLMDRIRRSILDDSFPDFKAAFLRNYQSTDADVRVEQKRKWLESRQTKQQSD